MDHATLALDQGFEVFVDLHHSHLRGITSPVINRQVITWADALRKVTSLDDATLVHVVDFTDSHPTGCVDFYVTQTCRQYQQLAVHRILAVALDQLDLDVTSRAITLLEAHVMPMVHEEGVTSLAIYFTGTFKRTFGLTEDGVLFARHDVDIKATHLRQDSEDDRVQHG
ncbi:hypothetical protein D3C87_1607060 [compost metagenome]